MSNKNLGGSVDALPSINNGGRHIRRSRDRGKFRGSPEEIRSRRQDTEIKIGNIMPYSGPASSAGVMGKTEAAYFNKINAEGGINGRRINFISYDDAYSSPKTVEQARKLVESDGVLLIFNSLGTPTNTAIHKYMNDKKVPQLFIATGATKWDDPFSMDNGLDPELSERGARFRAISA